MGCGPTWIQTSYQPQQRGNGQEKSQGIIAFCAHKEKGGVKKWIRTMEVWFSSWLCLRFFQMILGNLKSQTPIGWKRPPKVCSSTSCTRQVQLDQVVVKFSVSPRMEIPQTIWPPVPVFDHPHGEKFYLISICHIPICVDCFLCYHSSLTNLVL